MQKVIRVCSRCNMFRTILFSVSVFLTIPFSSLFAQSVPLDVGFEDFSYPSGTGSNSEVTAEKPERKLWYNDGLWWATMWSTPGNAYHIYQLDVPTQTWIDTGTQLDPRNTTKADVLWDGTKLYVVFHVWTGNGTSGQSSSNSGRLFRYSYDSVTQTYSQDAGFPVDVNDAKTESLVITKDSTGMLWITYVADKKVMVNHSIGGDDTNWATPFKMPTGLANVSSDDLSSAATFAGKVGVMWSNQANGGMHFAVHVDGAPTDQWSGDEIFSSSQDDHISMTSLACDPSGNVFVAFKTSKSSQLIMMVVCDETSDCTAASNWSSFPIYTSSKFSPTRPSLALDIENREVYVFTRNKTTPTNQDIYYKKSSIDNISFPSGIGTPFIKTTLHVKLNDPSTTRQILDGSTDLVVMASDRSDKIYVHGFIDLAGGNIPNITVTPSSHNFGNVALTQTAVQSFLVTNIGNVDLDITSTSIVGATSTEFNIDSGGGAITLVNGQSQTVNVSFNPTSLGSKTDTLRINSNDPDQGVFDVLLSGTGVPFEPDIAVDPISFDFGTVGTGLAATNSFQVQNTGTQDLNVTAASLSGVNATEFAVTRGQAGFLLMPGAIDTVEVSFNPVTAGGKSATLSLTSNDPDENPFDIALTGSGVVPTPDITVTPLSNDFGDVLLGNSIIQTFEVRNDGTGDLLVSGIALSGVNQTEFTILSGGTGILVPGAVDTIKISFNPTIVGGKIASLDVTSDDPDEPAVPVALTGLGLAAPAPDITVLPISHDYGNPFVGTSVSQTFRVRNDGQANLDVTSTSITGLDPFEFLLDSGGAPFTVLVGDSHDVVVSFNPNSVGAKTAALEIVSNDPNESPLDVALSGTGQPLPPGTGQVTREDVVTGGASSSLSVSTSLAVTAVSGDLYLAAITSKPNAVVTSVSGLGLVWTELEEQCSGRNQTGVRVWMARGTTSGNEVVTASFASSPSNAVIVVTRYSGADFVTPIGNIVSGNTNGLTGTCSGGTDSAAYGFGITTSGNGSRIYAAAAMRSKAHTPGSGYMEVTELTQGSGGSTAGIAIEEQDVLTVSSLNVDGSFSNTVDWSVIGLEIRAAPVGPQPDIAVSPLSHAFGDVVLGNSANQKFVVNNVGTADLTVTGASLTSGDIGDYSVIRGSTGFVVGAGLSDTVEVSFGPLGLGLKNATLTITSDDADEGSVPVSLSGTGVAVPAPEITVTPASHSYGGVLVGQSESQLFEVRNDGTADLIIASVTLGGTNAGEFTISRALSMTTLQPGVSDTVGVSFVPTSSGAKVGTLTITNNDADEGTLNVALDGSGVQEADIVVTPASHDYGQLVVATSDSQEFEVQNVGNLLLSVSSVTILGVNATDFTILRGGSGFALTPGQKDTVEVRFTPASIGARSGTLRLLSNDPDTGTLDVALTGEGVPTPAPDITVTPLSHDYGDVVEMSSASQDFEVRNDGTAALVVSGAALSGANVGEFSLDVGGGSVTLAPGEADTLTVSFNPAGLGPKNASLDITSNDSDEGLVAVALSGNGASAPTPDIAVAPGSHDYGTLFLGSSTSQLFQVRNVGLATLSVTSVSLVGGDAAEFMIESGGAFTVAAGDSHAVSVSFGPGSLGAKSTTLQVASDDPDEGLFDVLLTGVGALMPPGSGEVIFEEIASGGSSSSLTVSTTTALSGVENHLYLAAITSKPNALVTGVTGLGLTWVELAEQCAGRNQTGVRVWMALGSPTGGGVVTATLASSPSNAALSVTRYSGVDGSTPIGAIVSGNTNGVSGGCSGGVDNNAYNLPLTLLGSGSFIYGAAAMRNKGHNEGIDYAERLELKQGSGGSVAGLAVIERQLTNETSVTVQGTFSGTVDWAVIGIEVRSAPAGPQPEITVTPVSHDYGDVVVNTSGGSQLFEVRNDGTADLHVSSTTLVGTNQSEFGISSGGGALTLAPGLSAMIGVSFNPTSIGAKSGSLRIVSDDVDEGTLDVALSGNSVGAPAPEITVTPSSYDYGDVVVNTSASQLFVVKNDGTLDLHVTSASLTGIDISMFSIVRGSLGFTLTPGSTDTVEVRFSPIDLGSKTATLRILSDDSDEGTLDVALTGNSIPIPVPDIALVPLSFDYGDVVQSQTASHAFQIKNEGQAALNVSVTSITGVNSGEFGIVSGGGVVTIAAGDSETVTVSFTPSGLGSRSALFHVESDDADESVVEAALTGNGIDVPLVGDVVFEQAVTGGSTNSNSVETSAVLTGVTDDLYLAVISSKKFSGAATVTGLGLNWTLVQRQCSGRNQTGLDVWMGQGTVSGDGLVSAILNLVPSSATIGVARYSGADAVDPIGAIISGNSNGASGTCAGGVDNTAYSFNMTTSGDNAVIFSAAGMRHRTHEPGAGYTERAELHSGSGGNASSVAMMDQVIPTPGSVVVNGTFDATVDWAMVAIEVKPATPGMTMVSKELLLSKTELNSTGVAAAEDAEAEITLDEVALPEAFSLSPNYPNPFNAGTTIEYALPQAADVELNIYNMLGQVVRELVNEAQQAGFKKVAWNGRNNDGREVSSGIYFVRLNSGQRTFVQRISLQK